MKYNNIVWGDGTHETETFAIDIINHSDWGKVSILDLGTGSGLLAIESWKKGYRDISICDVMPEAIELAEENLKEYGVKIKDIYCCDILTRKDILKNYDVVIANLPPWYSKIIIEKDLIKDIGIFCVYGYDMPDLSRYEVLKKCEGNEYDIIYLKKKKEKKKWQE